MESLHLISPIKILENLVLNMLFMNYDMSLYAEDIVGLDLNKPDELLDLYML